MLKLIPKYKYNPNFKECDNNISLDNIQIQIFKIESNINSPLLTHNQLYYCIILLKTKTEVIKVTQSKIKALQAILDKLSDILIIDYNQYIGTENPPDRYVCGCSILNFNKLIPWEIITKKCQPSKIRELRKSLKDQSKVTVKQIREKRIEERKKARMEKKKMAESIINKSDWELLEQLQNLIQKFENPLSSLSLSLSLIFYEMYKEGVEIDNKQKETAIIGELGKLYPYIHDTS